MEQGTAGRFCNNGVLKAAAELLRGEPALLHALDQLQRHRKDDGSDEIIRVPQLHHPPHVRDYE